MTALHAVAMPLARTSEGMKAGPIGLAVILILCIVCYFLFKSMSKHLKTVRDKFPDNQSSDDPAAGHDQAASDPAGPDPVDTTKPATPTNPPTPTSAPRMRDGDPPAVEG